MNGQRDSFDGFLCPLALSMPHWLVLAVGATCPLICIQTDSVVTEEPLVDAAALGQSVPSSPKHGAGVLQTGPPEEATSPR